MEIKCALSLKLEMIFDKIFSPFKLSELWTIFGKKKEQICLLPLTKSYPQVSHLFLISILDSLFFIPNHPLLFSIGPNVGMIEVVPASKTTAEIQKESGGAFGALKEEVLWSYLKASNPRSDQQALVCFSFLFKSVFLSISYCIFLGKGYLHCFLCCLLCYFLCYGYW